MTGEMLGDRRQYEESLSKLKEEWSILFGDVTLERGRTCSAREYHMFLAEMCARASQHGKDL